MTLRAVARRLPTAALTGAVLGALLSGGAVHAIDTAAAEPAPCIVPAAPGAYTCTVVVAAPSATPEPSVVESATPPPTPTPSPTATPTASPSPTPTPTVRPTPTVTPPATTAVYGPAFIADTLANTQVGGDSCGCPNLQTSYRFVSLGGQLTSARFYLVDGSGYAGGTGGTIRVSVQTDSGGAPSGAVLASATIVPGNPVKTGYLPAVTFSQPATLSPGATYHLVFTNVDSAPKTNFVSVNSMYVYGAAVTQPQPQAVQLLNDGHGWTVRPNYLPIVDLGYGSGLHQGMGYMQIDSLSTFSSSGLAIHFTPTQIRTITTVGLRVERISGSGALTVTLGGVSATVPASAIAVNSKPQRGGPGMTTVEVPLSVTLLAGKATTLTLSAPSGTTYGVFQVECGISGYHFAPATCFADRGSGSPDDYQWWLR